MHFDYTEEQQQFADAVDRWLQKHYRFDRRTQIATTEPGVCAQAWSGLAELGTFAMTAPEAAGGFDGGAIDVALTMETAGRHLLIEPVLDTLVAIDTLKRAGGRDDLLAKIASGEQRLSCAFYERDARYDVHAIATTATLEGAAYRLRGAKHLVTHGATADQWIVSARLQDAGDDDIALFLVSASSAGLRRLDYRTADGQRAADIAFDQVSLPPEARLTAPGRGSEALERAVDLATAAVCAEALGLMQAMNLATFDYLKTRKQFGVALGTFQALQHRCVDMHIEYEQARVLTLLAAVRLQHAAESECRRAVSAAKVRVNEALRVIGENAVHLHGGIGVTDELPVSHYFKRGTMIRRQYGDTDHHLQRFSSLDGISAARAQT